MQNSTARIPLKELRQIQLVGSPDGDRREGFGSFADFALLSAVRTMHAEFIDDEHDGDGRDAFPPRISNVERLCLLNSVVRPASLMKLLFRIKCLDSFTYDHHIAIAKGQWIRISQIAALRQHAGHSLGSLALSGPYWVDRMERMERSLQGFEVLKELQLSLLMYFQILPRNETRERRTHRRNMQPLVYVVPPSVEKVTLARFQDCGNVRPLLVVLFVDFAEQKRLRLLRLKYVNFNGAR